MYWAKTWKKKNDDDIVKQYFKNILTYSQKWSKWIKKKNKTKTKTKTKKIQKIKQNKILFWQNDFKNIWVGRAPKTGFRDNYNGLYCLLFAHPMIPVESLSHAAGLLHAFLKSYSWDQYEKHIKIHLLLLKVEFINTFHLNHQFVCSPNR